jgi:hypothetical protein
MPSGLTQKAADASFRRAESPLLRRFSSLNRRQSMAPDPVAHRRAPGVDIWRAGGADSVVFVVKDATPRAPNLAAARRPLGAFGLFRSWSSSGASPGMSFLGAVVAATAAWSRTTLLSWHAS